METYRNAYSLLSNPLDSSMYKIAVRLQDQSRGGSVFMNQMVKVGDELLITHPANFFAPNWKAKKHLLLAGGVGITPFMSYIPEMQRNGQKFELHYMFHGNQTGAYKASLEQQLGDDFYHYDSDLGKRCELQKLIISQPLGTHIYVCGPASLIEQTKSVAAEIGLPSSMVHFEAFNVPKAGEPFLVEIKNTGKTILVGPEQSLLEALEAANVSIPNSCRGGQCACKVLDGEIEHRDSFLADSEKALGNVVMACVSRAQNERLVLDI
jgi:ferredoxin-NADP reductase